MSDLTEALRADIYRAFGLRADLFPPPDTDADILRHCARPRLWWARVHYFQLRFIAEAFDQDRLGRAIIDARDMYFTAVDAALEPRAGFFTPLDVATRSPRVGGGV